LYRGKNHKEIVSSLQNYYKPLEIFFQDPTFSRKQITNRISKTH